MLLIRLVKIVIGGGERGSHIRLLRDSNPTN